MHPARSKKRSAASELFALLYDMGAREARREVRTLGVLLKHQSPLIRFAAAKALGLARVGGPEIAAAIQSEVNELAFCEMADSLAAVGERGGLPRLYEVAEKRGPVLARMYALVAIASIEGEDSVPFLRKLWLRESGRRILAVLAVELFVLGVDELWPEVRRRLMTSTDYKVVCLISSLLASARPRRRRAEILGAMKMRLEQPGSVALLDCLERAIQELGG